LKATDLKLVVYTAVFGNYDALRSPRTRSAGVTYVCLADTPAQAPAGWDYRDLPRDAQDSSPASRNRWAKMHPHLLFPDYEVSVYVDGNIEVTGDVLELAQSATATGPLSLYDHPFRTCLYDEALACAWVGLDWLGPIRRQVARYAAEGFPAKAGLYEANVIVRRHHDPAVIRAMARWWSEWDAGIKRDQLSFTYAMWREGLKVNSLGRHDPRFVHRYFQYLKHRQPWRGLPQRLTRRYLNRARLSFGGPMLPTLRPQTPAS
jgi:hypothetical protein